MLGSAARMVAALSASCYCARRDGGDHMTRLALAIVFAASCGVATAASTTDEKATIKTEHERLEREQDRVRKEQKKLNEEMRALRREVLRLRQRERSLAAEPGEKPAPLAPMPPLPPAK